MSGGRGVCVCVFWDCDGVALQVLFFFLFQWRWPRLVFVLYRLLMAAYSIFAFTHMAVSLDLPSQKHNLMAYLTNWTYIVEMVFFSLGAILAVVYFFRPQCCIKQVGQSSDPERPTELQKCTEGGAGVDNPGFDGVQRGNVGQQLSQPHSQAAPRQQDTNKPKYRSMHLPKSGHRASKIDNDGTLSLAVQAYWVLGTIIQVFALIVSVVYFGALYQGGGKVWFYNLNMHAFNSVMIVIDIAVCARPVRILHMLYPLVYGFIYVIFSVVYWSQDPEENVLYENVLDWNKPGVSSGVVIGLTFVGVPLLQIAQFGIYRLRLYLFEKMYNESYV